MIGIWPRKNPNQPKLSDQIRQAIVESEYTRYQISQETGLDQAALSKFVHGERGLALENIDKLAAFLNLEIVVHKKGR